MESQRTFISTIHGGDQEDQHQNLTKPSYRLTFLVYLSHSSLAKVKCRLVASINRRSIPRLLHILLMSQITLLNNIIFIATEGGRFQEHNRNTSIVNLSSEFF